MIGTRANPRSDDEETARCPEGMPGEHENAQATETILPTAGSEAGPLASASEEDVPQESSPVNDSNDWPAALERIESILSTLATEIAGMKGKEAFSPVLQSRHVKAEEMSQQ